MKVTGETSVVHSFYIWHQNKSAQKQTQICTTSAGIIFLSEMTPAVCGWINRLFRHQGIDVWLWVSVLQSQHLSAFFFSKAETQGENNQEQVPFADWVDAAESLCSSLRLSQCPACKSSKLIWTNKRSNCSMGQFAAVLLTLCAKTHKEAGLARSSKQVT